MNKLVQHINMDMPGIPKQGMYCYGEASFEVNMEMQEPLEKLYKYENQPDMIEKVKEYISELETEINRCNEKNKGYLRLDSRMVDAMAIRIQTLTEVRNDLQGILEKLV